MATNEWLVLTGICLLIACLVLWAISRIFPGARTSTPGSDPYHHTGKAKDMNTTGQGHNHGGKSHLLGMAGIAAVVLVVLLGSGRSFQQALPYALFLACPLMMVGMMFMMRGGNGHQHGNDATDHRDHHDGSNQRGNDGVAPWQDSPNMASAPPQDTAGPDRPRR